MVTFAKLTDAHASEATSAIFVNLDAIQILQRCENSPPPHTKVFFELPPLLERDKGQGAGILWVKETPEEIFDAARHM